jgi:release factor glutamine methyltransferase
MTLTEWCTTTTTSLAQKGFKNAAQESKWLIAGALGRETSFCTLNPHYCPSPEEEERLQIWIDLRLKGTPLSRLHGKREFWSLPFYLNASTLDPRPETETLIEGVLGWMKDKKDPLRILDLGTGTGCILISLLHECQNATGVGADFSLEALEIARINAALNTVDSRAEFIQSDWGKELQGSFDIIVSNPPYIPLKDKEILEQNVLHFDPPLALFGGEDGLEAYKAIRHEMKRLLSPQGLVALEIGYGQKEDVETLFHEGGFSTQFILKDLAGIDRVLGFSHAPSFPL